MNPQTQNIQPKTNSAQPRAFYLPRLAPESYQGDAVVHWTLTVFDRATGWLTESFHARFRELMLHAAAREGLFCPVYCLMPDHLHLIWMGLRLDSDQKNGMSFLRTHLKSALSPARFQPQAHDHVLRADERERNAFAKVCFYILANPVRSGLVERPEEWLFHGAVVPGYPALYPLQSDYWEKFWRLYAQARQPDAGNLKRPTVGTVGADVRRL
jgi:REP element-mobilizing transposase RayT